MARESHTTSAQNRDPALQGKGLRLCLAKFVKADEFDIGMACLVSLNFVYVVFETDFRAKNGDQDWQVVVGFVFLLFYTIELAARIYVDRLIYFRDVLNRLDCFIVLLDFVTQTATTFSDHQPSLAWLRLLRVMRMLRLFRRLEGFRELWLMLHGLASAVRAMIWASFLILFVLMVWSLVAVETLAPIYDTIIDGGEFPDMGPNPFSTVIGACFTWFLLIVTGTGWFEIVDPIVSLQPWTSMIFMSAYVTINLGLMNLILTVIVDRAAAARLEDEASQVEMKKLTFEKARRALLRVCAEMDVDNSGELTLIELEQGFEENREFADTLKVMDVSASDLKTVYNILDEDKSGTITYEEFVDHLYKMKTQESHMMLVFIKYYVTEVREKVTEQLALLKADMKNHPKGDLYEQTGGHYPAETIHPLGCLGDAMRVDMTPMGPALDSSSPRQSGDIVDGASVRPHLPSVGISVDPPEKVSLSQPPQCHGKQELETPTLAQPSSCLSDAESLTPGDIFVKGKYGGNIHELQRLSERLNQAIAVFAKHGAAQQARIVELRALFDASFSKIFGDPAELQQKAPPGDKHIVLRPCHRFLA